MHAAGDRRHHVRDDALEPRLRHRLQDRLAALALPEVAAREPGPLLRRRQPRLRRLGRSALHGDARRPPRLPRPQHRRGGLGHPDHRHRRRRQGGRRHLQDGLQRDRRPAGDQGEGHHRHQRRRVRHPRLHRRLRRQDRQAALAVLHRPQRRRQGGTRPQGPGHLGGQLLAHRRRLGLGHRHLRPRAQHPLLGRRQPLARLQRRGPQGRQPLHLLDPGPQPGRRHLQVALPEQPPRRLGLRRRERAGAGRHHLGRQADQGAGPGASQRLLLLPEPRDRRVPLRQAVLRGHLDRPHQGGRRARPQDGPAVRQPGRAADGGGRPRLSRGGRRQGMEPDGLSSRDRARLSCR